MTPGDDARRQRAVALVDQGIAAEGAGQPEAATRFYSDAIALDASYPAARFNLALITLDSGDAAGAEREFRAALQLRETFPDAWVGLAEALEAQGRGEEALAALEHAMRQREHFAGAQLNASLLLRNLGRNDEAEARLRSIDLAALLPLPERHPELESVARRILDARPDHAAGWRALGTLLALRQRYAEAIPALENALRARPDDAELHNTLGVALHAEGRSAEAERAYRRALAIAPGYCEAQVNLGKVLAVLERPDEAEAAFCHAADLDPDSFEAHASLGNLLRETGRTAEAERCYRRALALAPDAHVVHNNLAIALQTLGHAADAKTHYLRAIALDPGYFEAHANLGNALQAMRLYSEAEERYRRALALQPDSHATHSNLGTALRELGRVAEAESSFRRALELQPDYPEAHSNLLLTLNYAGHRSSDDLFAEHQSWARRHEAPIVSSRTPHAARPDAGKRLRIGYVSPDFRRHSVAFFVEPLLAGHDRRVVEVFCYSNVANPDAITQRLLGQANQSRSIVGMSHARAADLVRSDGIDILVDLAGHTARGSLGLFVHKPAPVQVSYLGYPNTSGITAMDWRMTDAYADPPGMTERLHSEQLCRLPHTFLCFRPPEEAPEVCPPPHRARGGVTFGSFNVLPKMTPEVVAAWSALLDRVAGSRLLLKAQGLSDPAGRARVLAEFARCGIDAARLGLLPVENDFRAHLTLYHQLDIALDPFPYNGTTTTLEALWMGVPVITLAGDRHGARVGASILSNLGLESLIARSSGEYIGIAAGLAADAERLAGLRRDMRDRISASALRDEPGFCRAVEGAYRGMWEDHCQW